ncbi:MAG: peptidylprolyl isomerase, partial [Muribaculaceae bacterium]
MKKKLFLGALLGTALLAFAAKDPVIMKINGKDVKLSEFEYLYQKNNKQQIEKESLEQYVERFVIYKLKVNEAEEMQLDTMQSFIKEFNGYKNDLAKPYLEDSTLTNRLAQECYQRMLRNVDVSNIFLSEGYDEVDQAAKKQKIDSLYQCLKNGEDIEELAFKHSEDRNAKRLKGKMGYIRVGLLPYEFERIAFSTPVGQFSEPFHTMYGWHILKVNGERADDGKVLAEHILKLYPKDADDSAKAEVLNSMKEIHKRAVAGENFEELAIKESQDPGSAKNGGKLRLFGRGEMVPQFEKVAYELKDGEISEPFETQYGVHIIKKIMSKPVGTYQENAEAIKAMIERDERGTMAANAKLDNIKVKYGFKENPELENYIKSQIKDAAGNDSLFVESLKKSNFVIFSLGKEQVTMSEATQSMKPRKTTSPKGEMLMAKAAVADKAKKVLTDKYINEIYETEPNFHNLINEYHDGMLLFEI